MHQRPEVSHLVRCSYGHHIVVQIRTRWIWGSRWILGQHFYLWVVSSIGSLINRSIPLSWASSCANTERRTRVCDGEMILALIDAAVHPCRTSLECMKKTRRISLSRNGKAKSIYRFNVPMFSVSLGKNVLVNRSENLSTMARVVMRRVSAV